MIIIDQKNSRVFNFDNIVDIWVEDEDEFTQRQPYAVKAGVYTRTFVLGVYKSRETAIKVLENIANHYLNLGNRKGAFIMPKN